MAIEPALTYEGNAAPASPEYPFGSARNDSSLTAADGTPLEERWMNDFFGFVAATLQAAGVEPSNDPETAANSQILDSLRVALGGDNISWRSEQAAGDERLAAVDPDVLTDDTDWRSEATYRLLFRGTYRIAFEHFTTDTAGDGFNEVRIMVNGVQSGDVEQAAATGEWVPVSRDIALEDGDVVTIESRMDTGSPPREGRVRNRRISGDNFRLHALCSAGERTAGEGVNYERNA